MHAFQWENLSSFGVLCDSQYMIFADKPSDDEDEDEAKPPESDSGNAGGAMPKSQSSFFSSGLTSGFSAASSAWSKARWLALDFGGTYLSTFKDLFDLDRFIRYLFSVPRQRRAF